MVEAHHVFNIPRIIIAVKIIYFHQSGISKESGMRHFKHVIRVNASDIFLYLPRKNQDYSTRVTPRNCHPCQFLGCRFFSKTGFCLSPLPSLAVLSAVQMVSQSQFFRDLCLLYLMRLPVCQKKSAKFYSKFRTKRQQRLKIVIMQNPCQIHSRGAAVQ